MWKFVAKDLSHAWIQPDKDKTQVDKFDMESQTVLTQIILNWKLLKQLKRCSMTQCFLAMLLWAKLKIAAFCNNSQNETFRLSGYESLAFQLDKMFAWLVVAFHWWTLMEKWLKSILFKTLKWTLEFSAVKNWIRRTAKDMLSTSKGNTKTADP
jgi:hypothetical protein